MKNKPMSPIGDSIKEAEAQDQFLSRLSNIAYSKGTVEKQEKVEKPALAKKLVSNTRFKSRFFFHVDDQDELSLIEESVTAKPAEDPVNLEIIARADKYAKELPDSLKEMIELTREFFLKEIAPKSIALQGGLTQAKGVIEQQVGEIDASEFAWAERFAAHSSKLRVFRFIKEMFELTDDEAEKLYDMVLANKQPNVVVLPQQHNTSSTK